MAKSTERGEVVGDWLVIYRLETQDSFPIVTELHVVPCPPEIRKRISVQQVGVVLGPDCRAVLKGSIKPGDPPAGGLTGRQLRELAPHKQQQQQQETLSYVSERVARAHGYDPAGEPHHPGRRGRDDRFYAEIAADYVEACAHGSRHPVVDVADAHHYDAEYVRDVLHDARTRGLLTKPPAGRAGGRLTDTGEAALQAAGPLL